MDREIGRLFMEMTKFQNMKPSGQMKGGTPPPLQEGYDASSPLIDLSPPEGIKVKALNLRDAIEMRRSARSYLPRSMTLEELSFLLWCTQGVKEFVPDSYVLRTVPSAGARHAFETYLLINNVTGLERGLYRFLAIENKLIRMGVDSEVSRKVRSACLDQDNVTGAAVVFIWVAVVRRMNWRYGQRGYRYLHLDAGHVCENLYLASQAVDSGVCAIGAFLDDDMNSILGLDGKREFVIYIATVGKVR